MREERNKKGGTFFFPRDREIFSIERKEIMVILAGINATQRVHDWGRMKSGIGERKERELYM